MTRTIFEPVDIFKRGESYVVMRDWDDDVSPFFPKQKAVYHNLRIGQELRFRGSNLGKAEFTTADGKLVFLCPKQAFKIVGKRREQKEKNKT